MDLFSASLVAATDGSAGREQPAKGRERGGFRLIRCLTVEHNARRLKVYCDALGRLPSMVRFHRRVRLRKRFSTRFKASAERKGL